MSTTRTAPCPEYRNSAKRRFEILDVFIDSNMTLTASSSSSENKFSNSSGFISLKTFPILILLSTRAGAKVSPKADPTPAAGGIITLLIPSRFAMAHA